MANNLHAKEIKSKKVTKQEKFAKKEENKVPKILGDLQSKDDLQLKHFKLIQTEITTKKLIQVVIIQ